MSINASIVGRLTRNPEQRQTQNGTQVVSFNVAVDSTRKDPNGNRLTSFVRITVWGNRGNFILDHFMQGDPVSASGELLMHEYQDRNGNNRASLEMTADRVEFVPQIPRNRQPQTPNQQGTPQQNTQNNQRQAPQQRQQQYQGNQPQNNQNGSQQSQMPNNEYQNNGQQYNEAPVDIPDDQLPF